MDIIEIKILALKQLKKEVKKTEAYDGWTADDMLETFKNTYNYNPRQEYQYLQFELLEELFEEASQTWFEERFYQMKKIEMMHNVEKFKDFEAEIIANFNHFPVRVLSAITHFLLYTAANLNEV